MRDGNQKEILCSTTCLQPRYSEGSLLYCTGLDDHEWCWALSASLYGQGSQRDWTALQKCSSPRWIGPWGLVGVETLYSVFCVFWQVFTVSLVKVKDTSSSRWLKSQRKFINLTQFAGSVPGRRLERQLAGMSYFVTRLKAARLGQKPELSQNQTKFVPLEVPRRWV